MPRKSKAKKLEEVQELFEQASYLLSRINEDHIVPRNIRKIALDSLNTLDLLDDDQNTGAVCASTCISNLEDIAQDLNCPLHTRTQIYQILSVLEQVRD